MGECRVCLDKLPKLPLNAKKRMALLGGKLWGDPSARARPQRGQAPIPLRVAFLDGSATLQRKVKEAASEWMKHAHVKLAFGAPPDSAEIRVSFTSDPGASWSFLGTDCQNVPEGAPTMNYGWLTPSTKQDEVDRVVLHEFGHALGCVHEHSQPGAVIPWNVKKVYAFYKKLGWSKKQVNQDVLERYTAAETLHSRFDPKSIMLYPVSAELTDGKFESGWNYQLSAMDKSFIRSVYPRPKP